MFIIEVQKQSCLLYPHERNLSMPERKLGVIYQIFGALQKKKHVCDDIVTAAEKVVEDYILAKNKLIHKACRTKKKSDTLGTALVIVGITASAILLFMLF